MTRLPALCLLALLCYGIAVDCDEREHREVVAVEYEPREFQLYDHAAREVRPTRAFLVQHLCRCNLSPYGEIVRCA